MNEKQSSNGFQPLSSKLFANGWKPLLLWLTWSASIANAATVNVSGGGNTLRTAIAAAQDGDILLVAPGTYWPISTANKSIRIEATGSVAETIIDGGNTNRCATLGTTFSHTNTVLVGFMLRNGNDIQGGGAYGGTLNNCTLSGNTANLSNGGGAYYGTLNNCTLTWNTASVYGGGAYGSTLNNCTLSGNMGGNGGGGAHSGILNNCALSGNRAYINGGGAYWSTLTDCTLSGNTADQGGGAYYGTLNNCALTENTATGYGGGAYDSTLNNCALSGNTASEGGGAYSGTLNNCTLSGNTASEGGGAYDSTLNNCIVWGNFLSGEGTTTNYSGGTFRYSCTVPFPSGASNNADDPLFRLPEAWDFRLLAGSPCLNTGNNAYTNGVTDILGNPRVQNGTVDMGAYEGVWILHSCTAYLAQNVQASINRTDGVLVSWAAPSAGGAVLYRVCRRTGETGRWEPVSGWVSEMSFLDTQTYGNTDYEYAVTAAFDTGLDAISVLSARVTGRRIATVYYVDANRLHDGDNGTSWGTAKQILQSAIDMTLPGDEVIATDGVYAPIFSVNKTITISSVNGAAFTIIDGGNTNRCATLWTLSSHANTVLTGFTLRYGYATGFGGGVIGGALNDCTITGNVSRISGGGAMRSVLNRCTLTGNTASNNGGGAYISTLNNCTLSGNRAESGGGSYQGTLNNCTLTGNTVTSYGGGSYQGTLNNCTLSGNKANSAGGGSYDGTLNNCTLSGNTANLGGGSTGGTLNNCTLSGNTATSSGGGSYGGTLNNCTLTGNRANNGGGYYRNYSTEYALNNCIVYGNFNASGTTTNNYATYNSSDPVTFRYSCTTPLPDGEGNIDDDPMFRDAENGDFRLMAVSPCIDAGNNEYVTGEFDLDGNWRIQGKRVDMGAYEFALGDAVNAPHLEWRTGGDAPWFMQTAVTHDGVCVAQSGEIEDNQSSWIETTVTGVGTFSFWWKVSSEAESWPSGDWLICTTNGVEAMKICGEVDWTQEVLDITGDETVIRWTYAKDEDGSDGDDCGWLDEVTWTSETQTTPVPVPYSWLNQWQGGIVDYETFALSPGANGMAFWQSYVAGCDPTNATSRFLITNLVMNAVGSIEAIGWSPNYETVPEPWTGTVRVYEVEGKTNLTDGAWHSPTDDGMRFFRVKVSMP